jgi:hypothetical protein
MEYGNFAEKSVFGSDERREGISLHEDGGKLPFREDLTHLSEHFRFEIEELPVATEEKKSVVGGDSVAQQELVAKLRVLIGMEKLPRELPPLKLPDDREQFDGFGTGAEHEKKGLHRSSPFFGFWKINKIYAEE